DAPVNLDFARRVRRNPGARGGDCVDAACFVRIYLDGPAVARHVTWLERDKDILETARENSSIPIPDETIWVVDAGDPQRGIAAVGDGEEPLSEISQRHVAKSQVAGKVYDPRGDNAGTAGVNCISAGCRVGIHRHRAAVAGG